MMLAPRAAVFGVVLAAMSAAPAIFVNQVAYDLRGPKVAVIQANARLPRAATAAVIDDVTTVVQMAVVSRRCFGHGAAARGVGEMSGRR